MLSWPEAQGDLPGAVDPAWDQLAAELDQVVGDFQQIQDDVNYGQAQEALGRLVERLNLSPRERQGLDQVLEQLVGLNTKLEHTVVHIAVFGLVGRGKSSLLNALAGQPLFATGPTHGVTQRVEGVTWELQPEPGEDSGWKRVALPGLGASRVELIDTPGLEEIDGQDREALAQRTARQADLILFVVAGDLTRVEYEALKTLRQASKPILLVVNKIDQLPGIDRQQIYAALQDHHLQDLISPDEIVMAAAAPLVVQPLAHPDGSVDHHLQRGDPLVGDLKMKILDILQREGKALVALNSLLYASGVTADLLERKGQLCDRSAHDLIWNGAMIKAVAVALNPVTAADLFSGAVIDVALILALARLYGLPMTQVGALKLLRQIALGLGGLSLSELLVNLGLSSVKGLLGAAAIGTGGLTLAPYLPVALTQAGIAGLSTYGIGQVAKTYLANGANWGPGGARVVIQRILDNLDERSILNRIKQELAAKLG
ncbi:MAG: GTP-binding protein [Cyanobacteria bacterium REEB459]|nr:GTP-binding protein [Cyanobacteria bacterium REEB459]